MINKVILVGRITKDPEVKYTTSNNAVSTFTLAVPRLFSDTSGEKTTDFIHCALPPSYTILFPFPLIDHGMQSYQYGRYI